MARRKWNLNTIYISERLQECLRSISRCALATVVAPMGYGKTTAVNWYLGERAKAEPLRIIRISVLEKRTGRLFLRRASAAAGLRLPLRRRRGQPADGRPVPRAGRA